MKPATKPRACNRCGRRYYRRSLSELWTAQAPGHREGWRKTIVRLCPTCLPAAAARRALSLVTVRRPIDA